MVFEILEKNKAKLTELVERIGSDGKKSHDSGEMSLVVETVNAKGPKVKPDRKEERPRSGTLFGTKS